MRTFYAQGMKLHSFGEYINEVYRKESVDQHIASLEAERDALRQDLRDCISVIPSQLGSCPEDIDLENSFPHSREGHIVASAVDTLMKDNDALRADNARMREALNNIRKADYKSGYGEGYCAGLARAALTPTDGKEKTE